MDIEKVMRLVELYGVRTYSAGKAKAENRLDDCLGSTVKADEVFEQIEAELTKTNTLLKNEISKNAYAETTGKSIKDIGFDAIHEMLFQAAKTNTELSVTEIESYADNLVAKQ